MPRKFVEAHRVSHNGKKYWRVIVPAELNNGTAKRRYFENSRDGKAIAKAFADDLERQRQTPNARFLALPFEIQNAVLHAVDLLGDRAPEIVDAVRTYKARREVRTVAQVAQECIAAKMSAGKRRRSTEALERTFSRFKRGRETVFIRDVTTADIEAFINAPYPVKASNRQADIPKGVEMRPPSQNTKRARRIDIGTLFNFAQRRKYISEDENPLSGLETYKRDTKRPVALSIDQCERCLLAARELHGGQMLAVVVLQLFCGVRPEESYKLTWDEIGSKYISIGPEIAKVSDIRNIELNATMKAWLSVAQKSGAKLATIRNGKRVHVWDASKRMSSIHAAAGFQKWPADGFRHTFVSYGLQIWGWEKTINQAGHSLAMMLEHYKAASSRDGTLVTKSEAEKFWRLRP